MGAVAHAQRPFRAASFLLRRLTVGVVAHAPRPHAPGLRHERRGLQGNSARLQQGHIQSKKFNAAWPLLKVSLQ